MSDRITVNCRMPCNQGKFRKNKPTDPVCTCPLLRCPYNSYGTHYGVWELLPSDKVDVSGGKSEAE